MMFSIFLIIHFSVIFSAILLMMIIIREKPSKEQYHLLMMAIGVLLSGTGYFLSLISQSEQAAEFANIIQYMGNCSIIPFFLLFIIHYYKVYIPGWLPYVIYLQSALVFILVLTNSFHHLYYREYLCESFGIYSRVFVERGPLYLVYIVPQAIYNIALNYICIKRVFYKGNTEEKKPLLLFSIAAVVPGVFYLLYIFGFTDGYDPTPISYFIICLCVIIVIVYCHLFDMMEVMQEDILETMKEGFLVFHTDETILYYNAAAKHFFPELEKEKRLLALGRISEQEDPENIMIRRENCVMRIQIYPVYIRKVFRGYKGWIFDCTLSEIQRQRLVDLKEQAEQANMAKSLFLSNISHEIRTPMNAILGMAQLILRESGLTENAKENISNIQQAGDALLSTINDVLDFAKIESGKLEIIPVSYRLDRVLHDADNQTAMKMEEKDVEFLVDIDSELPSGLIGDEVRLRQILLNLLENAVKYTDFGKIIFRVGFGVPEETAEGTQESKKGKQTLWKGKMVMLKIEVSDTGAGIDENFLPNLFEPFQQEPKEGNHFTEGKGLGLSIVKRLLDLMGGEIFVKSACGCGSTFTVLIPQEVGDETPIGDFVHGKKKTGQQAKPYTGKFQAPKARVLAVDDNAVNLKVLKGLLSPYKIQVATALSGLECLEILREESYDLILMDYMMPEMDGIETLHLIRNMERGTGKTVPVAALTANAVKGAKEMFLSEGFQDYIPKPIDIKQMEDVLRRNIPEELLQEPEMNENSANENRNCSDMETFLGKEPEEPLFSVQVDGIDYEQGLSLFAGDKEQYLEIVKSIAEEGRKLAHQMCMELAEQDFKNYTIHAHALKGITANIGANVFSGQARELEFAGKEGRFDYIYEHHEEVLDAFGRLAEGMDKLILAEFGMEPENSAEEKMEISKEELLEKLDEIYRGLTEYYRDRAWELVKECLRCRMDDEILKGFHEMDEMIAAFQYEEPAKKAAELKEILQKQG